MKAVVLLAPQQFSGEQVRDPIPSPWDAIVRPTLSGLCGTDLDIHDGGFFSAFPLIPGHEIAGEVVALGDEVCGLDVGQRVVDNATPSAHCRSCGHGEPLFCENVTSPGVNAPGGFDELVGTPAAKVVDASDLPFGIEVPADPLSCVIHGMDVLKHLPQSTASAARLACASPDGYRVTDCSPIGSTSTTTAWLSTLSDPTRRA